MRSNLGFSPFPPCSANAATTTARIVFIFSSLSVQLPDFPDFNRSVAFEDGAVPGDHGGLGQARRLYDEVAAHQVLRFRVGAVGDDLLPAADHRPLLVERLAPLERPLLGEILDPRHPLAHVLLHLLRGHLRHRCVAAPEEKEIVRHPNLLSSLFYRFAAKTNSKSGSGQKSGGGAKKNPGGTDRRTATGHPGLSTKGAQASS